MRSSGNAIKMIAIVLIVAGLLGLIYGGFSYSSETRKSQESKSGSLEVFVKNTRTVHIPVWADAGAIIAGVLLLASANSKG